MSLKTNTTQCDKHTELLTVFTAHLSNDFNLARIRLICLFITALCKVKSVNYSKLPAGFDSPSAASSCFRQIQRFMAQADLPMRLVSTLIFNILQKDSPVVLVMDRCAHRFRVRIMKSIDKSSCLMYAEVWLLVLLTGGMHGCTRTYRLLMTARYAIPCCPHWKHVYQ